MPQNTIQEARFSPQFQREISWKLCHLLENHYSVNLVGMKRVGINCFLQFFFHHPEVRKTYLKDNSQYLFVFVDLNNLVEKEVYPFWILTQKRIVDTVDDSSLPLPLKEHLQTLFLNSIQSKELFLVIDNVRASLIALAKAGITPVMVFDRFDRLGKVITPDLFCNLESLRDATNKKMSYIFTTFREMIPSFALEQHLSLSLLLDVITVKPLSSEDARTVLEAYIEAHHATFSELQKKTLLDVAGGHVQYLRLAVLSVIHQQWQGSEQRLVEYLQKDERIVLQSEELWESLTETEQKVLTNLVRGQPVNGTEKQTAAYLWNVGIVRDNTIFSFLFKQYVLSKTNAVPAKNGEADFTKKELSLFTLFTQHVDEVIERSMIIETIWPDERDLGVSDWAIDRLVARVRTKLKKQNNGYELVTVKTRGYKLVLIHQVAA